MNGCRCCVGVEILTPAIVTNPSGLGSIQYRVGEHGSFFESMLAQLAGDRDFGLRTRETDDFSIAVLDAAAVVCDILSFYQERFANEHYLRTAKERQSLVGLGHLSGYRLAPGRAASTLLAFTLESAVVPPVPPVSGLPPAPSPAPGRIEGVPTSILIPAATKVQSVPGPGQKPQVFESIEDITAKPAWNSMPLRRRARYPATAAGFSQIELAGFVNALKEGDPVLLKTASATPVLTQVAKVDGQPAENRTLVTFTGGSAPSAQLPSLAAAPGTTPPAKFDEGYVTSAIRGRSWKQSELETVAEVRRWDMERLERLIRTSQAADASGLSMIVLGAPAALFGHNARDYTEDGGIEILATVKNAKQVLGYAITFDTDAELSKQGAPANSFYLDNTSQAAVPGRWIVLEQSGKSPLAAVIESVRDVSVSRFDLRARVTQVTLKDMVWLGSSSTLGSFMVRQTRVLIETTRAKAALPRFELVPGHSTAGGSSLVLDGPYFGLKPGRQVIVAGELVALPGQTAFEPATIAAVDLDDGFTSLQLTQPGGAALANAYVPETVRVLANVARATHGDTVSETLGSGDAAASFQRFVLKQNPLTFISAAVSGGIRAAITVRVNGIEWRLVDNLFADGQTYVVFGDGVSGARLPSGQENVTAQYRRGIGKDGNLDAGQLSVPLSRPLGLSSVVNPVPATGAGDPETLDEARVSLPFPLRTLGRIVTLQDYEDFARASAGIAKCSAHWIWDGHRWVALVTVAGPAGGVIPAGTPAFDDLRSALQSSGDPHVPAGITNYRPRFFDVDASLIVAADRVADTVLADARNRLRATFGFVPRAFVQPVFLSEVIAVLHNTEGVVAVDLNAFYFSGTTPSFTAPPPEVLTVDGPVRAGSTLLGAELLTLDGGALAGLRVKS
jgi:predicted phage baseplate assembly protein